MEGSKSNGFNNKGLFGSSPISLLGLPLLEGWCIICGVLGFTLSGFGFSCLGFLLI